MTNRELLEGKTVYARFLRFTGWVDSCFQHHLEVIVCVFMLFANVFLWAEVLNLFKA